MRIGSVDIPDERFHAVCDMGAAAVGLLTFLCAIADDCGTVEMSICHITKALKVRKATVCETLRVIADNGVAEVETRHGSGTTLSFPMQSGSQVDKSGSQVNKSGSQVDKSGSQVDFQPSMYKYYSTQKNNNNINNNCVGSDARTRTREEAPVERMDMEDKEEAARLKGELRYPTKWQEVQEAAEAYAIVMTQDEAEGFLAKYASVGWVRSGSRIRDWRYLIPAWHNNWRQIELDNNSRRTINGDRRDDRGNAGSTGGDCWGQAKFAGKYGAPTTEEEFLRMVGSDD